MTSLAIMFLMVGSAFLMGVFFAKNSLKWTAIFFSTLLIFFVGFYAELAKEHEGCLTTVLPIRTKWQVLSKTPINGKFAVILENRENKKIIAAMLKEEPPDNFSVAQKGWLKWKRLVLTPEQDN